MKTHFRSSLQFLVAPAALLVFQAIAQSSQAASWVTNGPMYAARNNHTATLLSNGKVLVAGGWNGTNYVASAELYDPNTGQWTQTGSMTTNRSFHTATTLQNGKVLVVGGYCNAPPHNLFSAELYDPLTGTWTNTGSTTFPRVYHTATRLTDGRVLVAGGIGYTAELYDPISGMWTNTGGMNRWRWYHTSTLLTNGHVLVAGGDYNYLPAGVFPTAEVYNPLTGIWTSTPPMMTNRTLPTATLLPDGRVLVAGGWLMAQVRTNPPAYSSFSLTSAELYDPVAGNWTATTNTMTTGRNDHTASLLPNGQVLLAGGFQNGPGDRDSLELFDPVTSAWIAITNKLNSARSHHTATLLPSGSILVAGGFNRDWVTNSTEVYDSAVGTWTNGPMLSTVRSYHSATLLTNGQVLIAGGSYGHTIDLSSAEIFNPITGNIRLTGEMNFTRRSLTTVLLPNSKVLAVGGYWGTAELYDSSIEKWTETGSLNTAREQFTATLLSNGKVIVVGGVGSDSLSEVATAEIYDPIRETWQMTGSMNEARYAHTATLLPSGKILAVGGNGVSGLRNSAELFDPASGKWSTTGALNVPRAGHAATLLQDGRVLVAGGHGTDYPISSAELYDPRTEAWTLAGELNFARSSPMATVLHNGNVLIAGGVGTNLAPIPNAELFIPSQARWVMTEPSATARLFQTATLLPDGRVYVTGGIDAGWFAVANTELYSVSSVLSGSWRPKISEVNSPLTPGNAMLLSGSQFRGTSGASGGNTQDSSSDYPLVQLRSIESGQTMFLQTTNWSTNSFTSLPVWNFPPGWAMATVFVNGISSTSSIVNIRVPVPTLPTITDVKKLTNGTFQFSFTNSVGAMFGVLTSTNVSLPLSNWVPLGGIAEISPGQFQFTDSQATNSPQRFYRVRAN